MKQIAAMILVALVAVFLRPWPAFGAKTALSEEELAAVTADPAQSPQGSASSEPSDPWRSPVVPYTLSKDLFFPVVQDTPKSAPPDVVLDRPPPVVNNPYFPVPRNVPSR